MFVLELLCDDLFLGKSTAGVPYSPLSEMKRSCPNIVCIISKVDSFCIFRFRGAAIAGYTSIVNWTFVSSPGRRNPCDPMGQRILARCTCYSYRHCPDF